MTNLATHTFQTPGGNTATMVCRENTIDADTCQAIMVHDEYDLAHADLPPQALVFDVGAYVGAFTVAVLLDWPDARVVAVEALAANVEMVWRNLRINGLVGRGYVVERAASGPGVGSVTIGALPGGMHEFVGAAQPEGVEVLTIDYAGLLYVESGQPYAPRDRHPDLLKLDCEGCEWSFLTDPAVADVRRIVGEIHGGADVRDRLAGLIGASHEITYSGPTDGTCEFVAVRR